MVTANISAVLRGYQQEGINWLGFLLRYYLNRASISARRLRMPDLCLRWLCVLLSGILYWQNAVDVCLTYVLSLLC